MAFVLDDAGFAIGSEVRVEQMSTVSEPLRTIARSLRCRKQ